MSTITAQTFILPLWDPDLSEFLYLRSSIADCFAAPNGVTVYFSVWGY